MSAFQYQARTAAGELVSGVVEAASQHEVLQRLAEQDLFTLRIEPASERRAPILGRQRVRSRQLAAFYSQLADLLNSGVPLLRSLEILQRQTAHAGLARILEQVSGEVADGTSLADALGRHPQVFSDLAVSMVRAGQEGGFLEEVLQRIAEFTEHQEDLRARVVGALAYPVFLLTVTCVVLVVMLTVFVPRFAQIFDRLREAQKLPVLTEVVLSTSAFVQANFWWLAAAVAVLVGMVASFARSEQGRLYIDRFKLWAPGLRQIWRGLAIARFARILGTMLANGIPILTALRVSKDSAGNCILAAAIDRAADSVASGDPLAGPLRACGHFPPDVVEMIAVGEESNKLDDVLVKIAQTTERRVTRQMELLVRLLEPILLLVMACVTLIMVASLLLPVFQMSQLM